MALHGSNAIASCGYRMMSFSFRISDKTMHMLSFASTRDLQPIVHLLLTDVQPHFYYDLRLGLQEALANAALHGNKEDPTKNVKVNFIITPHRYLWIISDEGSGFRCREKFAEDPSTAEDYAERECGRGLMILKMLFDEVDWNHSGNQLRLCKHINADSQPLFI